MGQSIQVWTQQRDAEVLVWLEGVSIRIGIGPRAVTEHAILDSITYRPGSTNTSILGRCPKPSPEPPAMPRPTRITTPLVLLDGTGRISPAPETIQPQVKASTVWTSLFSQYVATNFTGPLTWAISFGVDRTQGDAPIWVIQARGDSTPYGPCGPTFMAEFDATTGTYMGLTEVG